MTSKLACPQKKCSGCGNVYGGYPESTDCCDNGSCIIYGECSACGCTEFEAVLQ